MQQTNHPSPAPKKSVSMATVVCVLLIVGGIAEACIKYEWTLLAAGAVGVILTLIGQQIAAAITANKMPVREEWHHPLTERLDQIAILLNLMSEQQLLSDRAISIAYREKDREALRRAVQEDIGRHDWEAALSLIDEMERAYGNKTESQRLRKEITEHRQDFMRVRVAETVQTIDKQTRGEQWNAAIREAERLIQQFPENEQIKNLPHEIDNRRLAHKKLLMQSWHEAVARHDTDSSIDILRQLDPYLTSAEAESMQETVRGVFKERLAALGNQFAAAVKENRTTEILRIGDAISREFPNARMAQEVKEVIETLKKRSTEPAGASS